MIRIALAGVLGIAAACCGFGGAPDAVTFSLLGGVVALALGEAGDGVLRRVKDKVGL